MFAEHMKRGTPWDENPFGSFRYSSASASSGGSGGSSGSCSSEATAQHFIPIQILQENFQNSFDPPMDVDFEPKTINKIEIPDVFRQADQAARKQHEQLQREHRPKNIPPPLIPTPTTSDNNVPPRAASPFADQQQQQPLHSPNYNSNHVRHIPIIVEGGKQAPSSTPTQPQPQQSPPPQQQQPRPPMSPAQKRQQKLQQKAAESSSNVKPEPIPMPPPPSAAMNEDNKPPSPPPRSPKNKNPNMTAFPQQQLPQQPQQNQQQQQQQQQPQQQQPQEQQQQQPSPQKPEAPKTQAIPIPIVPQPPASKSPPSASQSIDESQVPPPLKKPTPQPPSTPMEKIQEIVRDVLDLEKQINEFTEKTKTKQYLYLDEMLTRKLITLDDIDCEGNSNVRQARKDCIKLVQNCINKLDAKLTDNNAQTDSSLHRSEVNISVSPGEKKDGANSGSKPGAGKEDKTKGSSDNKK